jgi:hypothetical protein
MLGSVNPRRLYLAKRPVDLDGGVAPAHLYTTVSVAQWERPQEAKKTVAGDRFEVCQGKIRLGRGLPAAANEIDKKSALVYRRVEIIPRRRP